MKIGEIINELRRQNGITQEQLAEAIGVSPQAVSKWENNASLPDITLLEPLAAYFQISIDNLIGFTPPDVERDIQRVHDEVSELSRHEKFTEAIELLKNTLKKYPTNLKLKIWLGNEYIRYAKVLCKNKGEDQGMIFYKLAVETLEGLSKNCSDLATLNYSYTTLFKAFIDLKRFDDARDIVKKISEYDLQTGKVYQARYYSKTGDVEKAIALFQEQIYTSTMLIHSCCLDISGLYNSMDKREKAIQYYKVSSDVLKAFTEPEKKLFSSLLCRNYWLTAIRYSKANKIDAAISALELAADYAIKSMTPDEIPEIFDTLKTHPDVVAATKPDSGYNVQFLIRLIENRKAYKEIQNHPEFLRILAKLKAVIN